MLTLAAMEELVEMLAKDTFAGVPRDLRERTVKSVNTRSLYFNKNK